MSSGQPKLQFHRGGEADALMQRSPADRDI
jgi:hypothetical protein